VGELADCLLDGQARGALVLAFGLGVVLEDVVEQLQVVLGLLVQFVEAGLGAGQPLAGFLELGGALLGVGERRVDLVEADDGCVELGLPRSYFVERALEVDDAVGNLADVGIDGADVALEFGDGLEVLVDGVGGGVEDVRLFLEPVVLFAGFIGGFGQAANLGLDLGELVVARGDGGEFLVDSLGQDYKALEVVLHGVETALFGNETGNLLAQFVLEPLYSAVLCLEFDHLGSP